jgi:hypothetical protein
MAKKGMHLTADEKTTVIAASFGFVSAAHAESAKRLLHSLPTSLQEKLKRY